MATITDSSKTVVLWQDTTGDSGDAVEICIVWIGFHQRAAFFNQGNQLGEWINPNTVSSDSDYKAVGEFITQVLGHTNWRAYNSS